MIFCNNCGTPVPDNSNFCQKCGAKIEKPSDNSELMFYCPNCDRQISFNKSVCPNCGFNYDKIKITKSIIEFNNRINAETTISRKAFVIRHAAFPSKTEDIKAFMFIAATNVIHADVYDEIVDSWMAKIEQCKRKASSSVTDPYQMKIIMSMYRSAINNKAETLRKTANNTSSKSSNNNTSNYSNSQLSDNNANYSNTKDPNYSNTNESNRLNAHEDDSIVCPRCNGTVKASMLYCPSCGYKFHNAKATYAYSVTVLNKKLRYAKTDTKKAAIIRDFVIPNTTEDIKEFTILAATNIKEAEHYDMVYYAWKTKLEQCKAKAEMTIKDPEEKQAILDLYSETKNTIQKKAEYTNEIQNYSQYQPPKKESVQATEGFLISNGGIIGGLLLIIISIFVDRLGRDTVLLEFAAVMMMMFSSFTLKKRTAHIIDYIITIIGVVLAFLLCRYLNSSYIIILGAVLTLFLTVKNYFYNLTHNDFF